MRLSDDIAERVLPRRIRTPPGYARIRLGIQRFRGIEIATAIVRQPTAIYQPDLGPNGAG